MLSKGIALRFRDEEGYTVLHACIDRRHEDRHLIMANLIAAGADVDLKGINDWTPLHAAVRRGDLEALRLLLEAGADRTIKTVIDHCCSAEEDAVQMGYAAAIEMFRTVPRRKAAARDR
jgi:ankyrin repeat protein